MLFGTLEKYDEKKKLFSIFRCFLIIFIEKIICLYVCLLYLYLLYSSKWNSNRHFCGSFAYNSLRSEIDDDAPTSMLAKPILDMNSKPLIQFAGEATNTHFYSTVHGAVAAGWREAQRLIDAYSN